MFRAPALWCCSLLLIACDQPQGQQDAIDEVVRRLDDVDTRLDALGTRIDEANAKAKRIERWTTARPPEPEVRRGNPPDDPPAEPSSSSREIEGAADAIRCPDDSRCTIDRAFVDKMRLDPTQLYRQCRLVPSMRDGEAQGLKIYGIRHGSLPKLLGFQNGDLVTGIGDEDIGPHSKLTALLDDLLHASTPLEVRYVRRGEALTRELSTQR